MGATVPVWYDPARPEDSALELNKPTIALIAILGLVGVGMVAMAVYLLVTGG